MKTTGMLVLICVVVTALLALTQSVTLDKINEQTLLASQAAQKKALPSASSFEEKQIQMGGKNVTYSRGVNASGETLGYVFQTSAKGYGGELVVMCGIASDGKVENVLLLSDNETPGLGKKAESSNFTDQYKKSAPQDDFAAVKGGKTKDNEIDAISGATITSKAVTAAVNDAVQIYRQIQSGGGK